MKTWTYVLRGAAATSLLLVSANAANAHATVDSTAARAVLTAIANQNLTRAEALKVADIPGNQAMTRKANDLRAFIDSGPITRETFADDLIAIAHGQKTPDPFRFARVRDRSAHTKALLDRIASDPKDFNEWIDARLKQFTPEGLKVEAHGYLIAGGLATGFAFGGPEFYLDLISFDGDFDGARVIMAHELYHSVQGIAQAKYNKEATPDFDTKTYEALTAGAPRDCYAVQALFNQLVAEGTATYLGDPALITGDGAYAVSQKDRWRSAIAPVTSNSITSQRSLLEMSVRAVTGHHPMSVDDVYAVGFYGNSPLYDVGYIMSKAIVAHDGDAALGTFIYKPGSVFVNRYIALAADPKSNLPPLGPQTVFWAKQSCMAH